MIDGWMVRLLGWQGRQRYFHSVASPQASLSQGCRNAGVGFHFHAWPGAVCPWRLRTEVPEASVAPVRPHNGMDVDCYKSKVNTTVNLHPPQPNLPPSTTTQLLPPCVCPTSSPPSRSSSPPSPLPQHYPAQSPPPSLPPPTAPPPMQRKSHSNKHSGMQPVGPRHRTLSSRTTHTLVGPREISVIQISIIVALLFAFRIRMSRLAGCVFLDCRLDLLL